MSLIKEFMLNLVGNLIKLLLALLFGDLSLKTDGVLKGIPYFVGDVFKAAGWRAPAKHVRGTIFSSKTNWFSWTGPNYLI